VDSRDLAEVRRTLWAAADQLRANSTLAPSEYRSPVLGLIFLAYAEHRFDEVRPEIEAKATPRRPTDQVQWLHHVTEVGEYGLALEDMAAMLTHAQIVITDQERDDMLALALQMEINNRVSDALRSCPHAD
jgi:type I restriction-modification system DNA methylase subunit